MLEEYIKNLKEYAKDNHVPIIRDKSLDIMLDIIKKNILEKSKENRTEVVDKAEYNILEIGTAIGYSASVIAIEIAKYIKENNIKHFILNILTIEKEKETYIKAKDNLKILIENIQKEIAEENIFKLNISLVNNDARIYLEDNLKNNMQKYDIVFIDANKSAYLDYYEFSKKMLNNSGIIICDNVLLNGWVLGTYNEKKHRTTVNNLRKFLKYIQEEEKQGNIIYTLHKEDDGILEIEFNNNLDS